MHRSATTAPKFSLTASMRRAGATKVDRTGPQSFAVAFEVEGDDYNAPGKGAAVVEALKSWAEGDYEIIWGGKQAQAVMAITRPEFEAILARLRRDVADGFRLAAGQVTAHAVQTLADRGEVTFTTDEDGILTVTPVTPVAQVG